jgi:hypothetical protein
MGCSIYMHASLSADAGPVVMTFGSLMLRFAKVSALTIKYFSVSIALPGPMMGFQ